MRSPVPEEEARRPPATSTSFPKTHKEVLPLSRPGVEKRDKLFPTSGEEGPRHREHALFLTSLPRATVNVITCRRPRHCGSLLKFGLSSILLGMESDFYLRYYVGHKGKFGHEFLEFEFRPDGKSGFSRAWSGD
ncbi:Hypothetical predicted protein [Marmota monax]|uniref:Protein mago nashi-like n=1 Tax=Marmota monax TaxID=9995 RepID=A0A5E4BDS9_MARMO|nr:protein mago nashi-like [Marmota monax]VTJ67718.1 Hypothetical predicted protein [Marmota monax]